MPTLFKAIMALALALACIVIYNFIAPAKRKQLPPGPRPLPFVGNMLNMPRKNPWETFAKWSKLYGDVVYLHILGRPIILLNTLEAANDLLEKRFPIYSDRPHFPVADMVGHGWNFGFMSYGKQWQYLRRVFSTQYTTPVALRAFHDAHTASVAVLLQNLLHDPENFSDHIRLRAAQLLLDVTYGIRIDSAEHLLVQTAEAVMNVISFALSPKMWLVNPMVIVYLAFNWFRNETLPRIRRWQEDLEDLRHKPFNLVKQYINNGTALNCFVTRLLQEQVLSDDSSWESVVRDAAAIAFGAGYETTITAGEVFLLAMTLYPEVQKAAQDEIDRVVGAHRLPDFSDRGRLPYVTAVMKETLRWHPPAPTGIPHLLREDDYYKGFYLPQGAIVMGNVWGILHDKNMYPEPEKFRPERYIRDGIFDCAPNDPSRVVFGFGRRVCPGRLFSEDSLWLTVAQTLAVYSISVPDGMPQPLVAFVPDAISRPKPFKCLIRPRSAEACSLVENTMASVD